MTAARSTSLSKKTPRKQDKVVWTPNAAPFCRRCLQMEVQDAQFSFSRSIWVDVLLSFVRAVLSTLPWLITPNQVFGTRSSDLAWTALMAWWKTSSKTPPSNLQSRNSQTTVPEKRWSRSCGLQAWIGSQSSRWQVTRTRNRWTTTMKEARKSSGGFLTSHHSQQSSALREIVFRHPAEVPVVYRAMASLWIIFTTAKSGSTFFRPTQLTGVFQQGLDWLIHKQFNSTTFSMAEFFRCFIFMNVYLALRLSFFSFAMSKLIGSNKSVIMETNEMHSIRNARVQCICEILLRIL